MTEKNKDLKQFYNSKTGKWHVLKRNDPGKQPPWKVDQVNAEKLPGVPVCKKTKQSLSEQESESPVRQSGKSSKDEQNETENNPDPDNNFLDWF